MTFDFIPPRRAMIEHIKDDGSTVMVECEVDTDYEDGTYWVSYTDPEDEQCVIEDAVPSDELQFIADGDKQGAQDGALLGHASATTQAVEGEA